MCPKNTRFLLLTSPQIVSVKHRLFAMLQHRLELIRWAFKKLLHSQARVDLQHTMDTKCQAHTINLSLGHDNRANTRQKLNSYSHICHKPKALSNYLRKKTCSIKLAEWRKCNCLNPWPSWWPWTESWWSIPCHHASLTGMQTWRNMTCNIFQTIILSKKSTSNSIKQTCKFHARFIVCFPISRPIGPKRFTAYPPFFPLGMRIMRVIRGFSKGCTKIGSKDGSTLPEFNQIQRICSQKWRCCQHVACYYAQKNAKV